MFHSGEKGGVAAAPTAWFAKDRLSDAGGPGLEPQAGRVAWAVRPEGLAGRNGGAPCQEGDPEVAAEDIRNNITVVMTIGMISISNSSRSRSRSISKINSISSNN